MIFYIKMPEVLKPHFYAELDNYRIEFENQNWQTAWRHLERAHIIGQQYPIAHTYVHWKMLCFGMKIKNAREIFGQIPRLLFGGVKSFVGHVPIGNPGGSNVPPLKSFSIEEDLQFVLNKVH